MTSQRVQAFPGTASKIPNADGPISTTTKKAIAVPSSFDTEDSTGMSRKNTEGIATSIRSTLSPLVSRIHASNGCVEH